VPLLSRDYAVRDSAECFEGHTPASFSLLSPVGEWICECANDTCTELIEMTAAEYEAIRSDGARFFVAPGDEHVCPDVEKVTEHGERYRVVEKTGHAGSVARSHDPRSDEGPLPLRT
jgi:hypothetical protein